MPKISPETVSSLKKLKDERGLEWSELGTTRSLVGSWESRLKGEDSIEVRLQSIELVANCLNKLGMFTRWKLPEATRLTLEATVKPLGQVDLRASEHSPEYTFVDEISRKRRSHSGCQWNNFPPPPSVFVGRTVEIATIQSWLASPTVRIGIVAGGGGMGKTSLIGSVAPCWPKRIFAWSFRALSDNRASDAIDRFLDSALRFFGEAPETVARDMRPFEIAKHLANEDGLLLLDAVGTLPTHVGTSFSSPLSNDEIQTLLYQLVRELQGKCLITSRSFIMDLADKVGEGPAFPVRHLQLQEIDQESQIRLMKERGIKGSDEELADAARNLGGHPLTLTMATELLLDIFDGVARRWPELLRNVQNMTIDERVQQLLQEVDSALSGRPEHNLLRSLAILDHHLGRDADAWPVIDALANPPIPAVSFNLKSSSCRRQALNTLERFGIVDRKGNLHRIAAAFFSARLREQFPADWKESHSRLFEYFQKQAPTFPADLPTMIPLYRAIKHGANADRRVEAFRLYAERVSRGDQHFSMSALGVYREDLAAMSSFYDESGAILSNLPTDTAALVLAVSGFCHRAIGDLPESVKYLRQAADLSEPFDDWVYAPRIATYLAEVLWTIGEIGEARTIAEHAKELADQLSTANQNSMECRIEARSLLGEILHYQGKFQESADAFRDAECLQATPLTGLPCARYCHLLLTLGQYAEVLGRISSVSSVTNNRLIESRLALCRGRALVIRAFSPVEDHSTPSPILQESEVEIGLQAALDGFRKAGLREDIPWGLLGLAEWFFMLGQFERSQNLIQEAITICVACSADMLELECQVAPPRWMRCSKLQTLGSEALNRRIAAHRQRATELDCKIGLSRFSQDLDEIGRC